MYEKVGFGLYWLQYALNNPLIYTDPTGYSIWTNNWFTRFMDWVNGNTVGLRQKMVDIGVPDFNVGINSAGNTFQSFGNSGYIYHNQLRANSTEAIMGRTTVTFNEGYIDYRGVNFVNNLGVPWDNVRIGNIVSDTSELLSDAWNSTVARLYIPDYVHIGVGFVGIAGCGAGTSFELNWVLRGPQASIKPIFTTTVTVGGGYQVDATLNIGGSRYFGSVNEIRRDFLQTNIRNGQAGIFGSGGGSALGKIGFTGTWTPTNTGYGLFQTEFNIGFGLTPGPNGAGGASNTYILYDFY